MPLLIKPIIDPKKNPIWFQTQELILREAI